FPVPHILPRPALWRLGGPNDRRMTSALTAGNRGTRERPGLLTIECGDGRRGDGGREEGPATFAGRSRNPEPGIGHSWIRAHADDRPAGPPYRHAAPGARACRDLHVEARGPRK